jgi:hypothetical protein
MKSHDDEGHKGGLEARPGAVAQVLYAGTRAATALIQARVDGNPEEWMAFFTFGDFLILF